MATAVVTLMWGTAWDRYGEVFAESFRKYWPKDVRLIIITDRVLPVDAELIMLPDIPGFAEFKAKWGSDKKANGYDAPPKAKVNDHGYSWRHDAVKWAPQGLAPAAAVAGLADGDALVWFDADVETIAPVPAGWIDRLLGGADVACLQRPGIHSEIGFHAVRVSAGTRDFLRRFSDFYTTGAVFGLKETHSAYVYDRSLEGRHLKVRNLNEGGGKGHVWPKTALAMCTSHFKGKRKDRRAA